MSQPSHVMVAPSPICARCGDIMLYLDRFTPPAFTARAFCGRCDYVVTVTAQAIQGVSA